MLDLMIRSADERKLFWANSNVCRIRESPSLSNWNIVSPSLMHCSQMRPVCPSIERNDDTARCGGSRGARGPSQAIKWISRRPDT
jgi:hypothetical protein